MEDSIQRFLDYIRTQKRYSEHTLAAYGRDIRTFHQFLTGQSDHVQLIDITNMDVRAWLASLREDGLSARSANRKLSSLRSFFKYHHSRGTIDHNPCGVLKAMKVPKRLVNHMTEDAMGALLSQAPAESFESLRSTLIVRILYATGMRRNELVLLSDQDIDPDQRLIRVFGKGRKVRQIPVSAALLDLIGRYQELRSAKFPTALTDALLVTDSGHRLYPKFVYNTVRKALGAFSTLKKKSPHVLRHTFATHLSSGGADINAIKELLGHANLGATQIYTHSDAKRLRDAYLKAHPKSGQ